MHHRLGELGKIYFPVIFTADAFGIGTLSSTNRLRREVEDQAASPEAGVAALLAVGVPVDEATRRLLKSAFLGRLTVPLSSGALQRSAPRLECCTIPAYWPLRVQLKTTAGRGQQ